MKPALNAFKTGNFTENALNFFETLGYNTEDSQPLTQKTYAGFARELKPLNETNALVLEWIYVDQLFFLTPENTKMAALRVGKQEIHAYMIFGIELKKSYYSRSDLAKITRELNRKFDIAPILVLFKHGDALTLSVINRRLHKRDESRDVLEKVTLIKDIRLENTHRAHLDILDDLVFSNLKNTPTNFVELHNAWQKVLNTKTLNKQFYEKLFDWYLLALSEVKFPQIRADDDLIPDEQHQSESLIRLLTRLLFVWFMKEKGLIDAKIFDQTELKSILKNFTGENSNDTIFYKAILQNLFFATLNMPIGERKVIVPRTNTFPNKNHGNQLVYRYAELFNDADFKSHFDDIPFLNGGLFDCLDQKKDKNNPDSIEIRLDGFSTQAKKQAVAPDKLFFGEYKNVDLSGAYDNKKKSNVTVYGLIDILQNHKFTVEENTPLEEDIALDPELLGQVFENLLAAYNPETGTTARKQTGSFYTPREIVDYMVDESLIAYFGVQTLVCASDSDGTNQGLYSLLSYNETQNPFDAPQTNALISAIDNLKILDPACGSGAFPMGILHKLVFVLSKLDPKNEQWRDRQIAKLKTIDDSALREKATQVIHDAFENNELDYGRKLFLIENCIHGVDIQPIATQISKLRFFISLIVDQKSHGDKSNNFGIRPLPNLDFKIIAANTLIAAPQEDEAMGVKVDSFFENFSDLTHDYFKVANPDDKRKLRDKIETLINAKCDEKLRGIKSLSHNETKNKKQIDQLESHQKLWQSYANLFKHEAVAFFEPRYFFPQLSGGFDIVIGNPPYVFARNSAEKGITEQDKKYFYGNFKLAKYQVNLYPLFIEKGHNLIKNTGILCYITPNNWLTINTNKDLRKFVLECSNVKIVNFYAKVFESAAVDSCIITFSKSGENQEVDLFEYTDSLTLIHSAPANYFLSKKDYVINVEAFKNNQSLGLIDKIEAVSVELSELADVKVGLKAYQIGKGKPQQTEVEKNTRTFHAKEKLDDSYIKYFDGKDVCRYQMGWSGEFLKYGSHLAEPRNNFVLFSTKRILIRQIPSKPPYCIHACLIEETALNDLNSMNLVRFKESPEFILAVLNSRLISYWFVHKFGKMQRGVFPQFKVNELASFPIPKITADQQQPFIKLVDKILADKKAGNDTRALEREIDVLVYGLYGLSEEEILIVEGGK